MKEETIQQELEGLAEKLSVKIIYERFYGAGGMCRVKDEKKIIINKDLPLEKINEILLTELSQFDLENVYLAPQLRKLLEAK
jgi:hypothetical protein